MTKLNYSNIKEVSCTTAASKHGQISSSRSSSWSPSEICRASAGSMALTGCPTGCVAALSPHGGSVGPTGSVRCPPGGRAAKVTHKERLFPWTLSGCVSFNLMHLLLPKPAGKSASGAEVSSWGFPRRKAWSHLTRTPLQSPRLPNYPGSSAFLSHVESSQINYWWS